MRLDCALSLTSRISCASVGVPAGLLGGGQVVEGAVVGPALHLRAFQLGQHLVLARAACAACLWRGRESRRPAAP